MLVYNRDDAAVADNKSQVFNCILVESIVIDVVFWLDGTKTHHQQPSHEHPRSAISSATDVHEVSRMNQISINSNHDNDLRNENKAHFSKFSACAFISLKFEV